MDDVQLWQRERDFWLSPAADNAAGLSPHCLMAFAPPTGILRGREAVLAGLRAAPRWAAVELEQRTLERAGPDIAVLAYRALASRPGEPPYRAYCSSTYRRDGRDWSLIQHQQTPIAS
ncbi:nuclear transport factor 2 family protein [Lysobacter firmicutimachus]|uniref:Nuclear transport factor 2 family protein n=1 Tax=Lysobacter firmicutimachus TaxID=1792846 RepID=A0AAU8MTP1_9GAMM